MPEPSGIFPFSRKASRASNRRKHGSNAASRRSRVEAISNAHEIGRPKLRIHSVVVSLALKSRNHRRRGCRGLHAVAEISARAKKKDYSDRPFSCLASRHDCTRKESPDRQYGG